MTLVLQNKQSIEIDSIDDGFGILYRVWRNQCFVGSFYQRFLDGKWVSQSINVRCWDTKDEAVAAVIA